MKYKCSICGYIYDDEKEQMPFNELPDSWCCPICGAPKSVFVPLESEPAPAAKPAVKQQVHFDDDMEQLSAGQLAALFSNLARGCEKQYKQEETELFHEIAVYFTEAIPSEETADLETLSALLKADINERYPLAKATAENNTDRGAQRICVWGDSVSRMLDSLLDRYRNEGETMLKGMEVWICTVCGFVYIGENPPELCPVCKVPSRKFEKAEGRR